MNKMTIRDIDVAGKRVLVRVDFNVPVDAETGEITDDSRIRAALPTIEYLIGQNARVILMSHLGRPKGKVSDKLRLAPVAKRLSELLGQQVAVTTDCIGPDAEKAAAGLESGRVVLLENLRFHAEEEAGDKAFAGALAKLGDVYVDDAFGTAHRAHASVSVIAEYLPAVAGFLMEKEIATLGNLLENPEHPFTAMFGGAKVSDKSALLKNIMDKVDCVLIGGGMAASFLKAKSYEIGQSLIEEGSVEAAGGIISDTSGGKVRLVLPIDVVVADDIVDSAEAEVVPADSVPLGKKIADIGPQSVIEFGRELKKSKTLFWNGPVGVHEIPKFAGGTKALAEILAGLDATTVIGGGSTAEVIHTMGLTDKVTFVSTGGGASLEFLGGEALPGVVALMDKEA